MTDELMPAPAIDRSPGGARGRTRWLHGLRRFVAFDNMSAVYVGIVIFAVFAIWIPQTFLSWTTWKTIFDNQAVAGLAAVALVMPLAAGAFNLAVGVQVGLASILVGWLLIGAGMPSIPAILVTLLVSAGIGWATGILVVRTGISSFIATLGVSSLLGAVITAISGGRQILGMPAGFDAIGTDEVGGFTVPAIAFLAVAAAVWYLLERTPFGRRVYATGGNPDAARLAGVHTGRIVVVSLTICGLVAGIAGTLVTARLANADPTIGPAYMLPAFTAAFLGSTQFKRGRYNVWGTVLSVYVLAMGVKGIQLTGAPVWVPDAFNGVALLIAVAISQHRADSSGRRALGRLLRRGAPSS